jgi:hypothetical protein
MDVSVTREKPPPAADLIAEPYATRATLHSFHGRRGLSCDTTRTALRQPLCVPNSGLAASTAGAGQAQESSS